MSRRILSPFLACIVILLSFTIPASAYYYKPIWKPPGAYSTNSFYPEYDTIGQGPIESCKRIGPPIESIDGYKAGQFTGLKNEADNSATCVSEHDVYGWLNGEYVVVGQEEHEVDIVRKCMRYNDDGTVDNVGTGYCPVASTCSVEIGNPTSIQNLTKIERVKDWVSSLDSRFEIARTYRSDIGIIDRNITDGPFEALGGVWADTFSGFVRTGFTTYSAGPTVYFRDSGESYHFGALSNPTPNQGGHKFTMSLASDGRPVVHDGAGKELYFEDISQDRYPLNEIRWADGYEIQISRDANHRIDEVSDNRGQLAKYTWSNTVVPNSSVFVVTQIEVDANYDSSNFSPEVAINYTYFENSILDYKAPIATVTLDNVAASTTKELFEYTYDIDVNTFPPMLLTISDGRLDQNGNSFATSTFTYGSFEQINPHTNEYFAYDAVLSSSHFGGADQHQFEPLSNGTIKSTNPLSKETIFTLEYIERAKRVINIDGTATTSCLGTSIAADYTPNSGAPAGFVYERTERNGAVTKYTRDSRGLVTAKTEDANGLSPRVTNYTWHASLRLPLTRTTKELQESFTYSTSGQLLTYSQTDNIVSSPSYLETRTWTYTYTTLTSGLEVLTSVDGPGLLANSVLDVTTYTYDALGVLASVTDPNGLVTTIQSSNAYGQPTLIEVPNTGEWAFTYDIEGRVLTSVFNPNGASKTTTYTYDSIGQMTSLTNTNGDTWSYAFNEAKRMTAMTDPRGDVAEYSYDAMGNVTGISYKDGGTTIRYFEDTEYDKLGRVLKTLGAQGQITNFSHDKEDNLATATDPQTNVVTNSFDPLNRLISVVDRNNNTTAMEHNPADQTSKYTDPNGYDTDFTYNGFGEIVTETGPDRGTITHSYNTRGLTASMTDARGIVSNYAYDNGGRLTSKSFPAHSSQDQSFAYDVPIGSDIFGIGQLGTISDESGSAIYRYRENGQVSYDKRTIEGERYVTFYHFDDEGLLKWIRYPSMQHIEYTYDDADKVTRIRTRLLIKDPVTNQYPAWKNIFTNGVYEPFGPLKSHKYGDGATHTASYDDSYRLTALLDTKGAVTLRDVDLGYSTRDNLTSVIDQQNFSNNETFTYSLREMLATANGDYGQKQYTYDPAHNRTALISTPSGGSAGTDTYSYGTSDNRLVLVSESSSHQRTMTYDAAGNVTYDNRSGGGYGYTYNAAGRMASMSINGITQAEYEYNALGQQVVRRLTQAGQTIHSIYDLEGKRIEEYLFDPATSISTLIREYVWLEGKPVAVIEGGVIYYVRSDHIGRPVLATDGTAAKVWEVSYLPFGGVHVTSGTPIDLRFPGQWFQSESGLHQNWMRDYDPTTGRYIEADPLGLVDGPSVYGYALQNPGRYVDPRGEFTLADARNSLLRKLPRGSNRSYFSDQDIFSEWLKLERSDTNWLKKVPRCSCNTDNIDFDIWNPLSPADQDYHPGGILATRSKSKAFQSGGQCIYDGTGNLIRGAPGGGSADYYAPKGLAVYLHYTHDVQTYNMARKLGNLDKYFEVRPSR